MSRVRADTIATLNIDGILFAGIIVFFLNLIGFRMIVDVFRVVGIKAS